MYTKYNKYSVHDNILMRSSISDQCYFYAKYNKNAPTNFIICYVLKTESYQKAPDCINHFKIFLGSMPPNPLSYACISDIIITIWK